MSGIFGFLDLEELKNLNEELSSSSSNMKTTTSTTDDLMTDDAPFVRTHRRSNLSISSLPKGGNMVELRILSSDDLSSLAQQQNTSNNPHEDPMMMLKPRSEICYSMESIDSSSSSSPKNHEKDSNSSSSLLDDENSSCYTGSSASSRSLVSEDDDTETDEWDDGDDGLRMRISKGGGIMEYELTMNNMIMKSASQGASKKKTFWSVLETIEEYDDNKVLD